MSCNNHFVCVLIQLHIIPSVSEYKIKTMKEQYIYIVSTFDNIFVLGSAFVINSLLFLLCALLLTSKKCSKMALLFSFPIE